MEVSVEKTSGLGRKMTVQVPADEVEQEVTSRLQNLAKRVRMDGFRPGKVPFKVVRRRYDGQVRSEVVQDVMRKSLASALQEKELRPAGGPHIDPLRIEPGEALEFSATFEVYPDIELAPLDGVTIEKPTTEVTDADVDRMLEKLRTQRATFAEVDRPAQEADQLTLDFEGSIDGEAFAGGSGQNVPLVLGSNTMIAGFEDQLTGVRAGEDRVVKVTFPENYGKQELAGQEAQFNVHVNKVAEPVLPELDDEFARAFGVQEGGVEALRIEVRSNMERELQQKTRALLKERVMDALLKANEVDVPAALVDEEIDRNIRQSTAQQPQLKGLQLPRELFEEQARKRVKLGLLLGELIRDRGIALDQERMQATLEDIAQSYEQPEQVKEAYRSNRNLRTELEGHVLEEQVVDDLLNTLNVEEKSASFEELMETSKETSA